MSRVAILQSNYIPWKGYFDLINGVDFFVIYDDVQYTKNDWRNRNKIKTSNGLEWLTIPVKQEKLNQSIKDTKISGSGWNKKHWKTIRQNYSKAKHFSEYVDCFESVYLDLEDEYLSEVNYKLLLAVNEILGVKTEIRWSSEFDLAAGKNERLIEICKSLGGDVYLSGPAAKGYLDEALFATEGIMVEWMNYTAYPEYNQLYQPFEHGVTILDLIFNEGQNSVNYMKSFVK